MSSDLCIQSGSLLDRYIQLCPGSCNLWPQDSSSGCHPIVHGILHGWHRRLKGTEDVQWAAFVQEKVVVAPP